MKITTALKSWILANRQASVSATATDAAFEGEAYKALGSGDLTPDRLAELTAAAPEPGLSRPVRKAPAWLTGGNGSGGTLSTTKSTGLHVKSGRPVLFRGQEALLPSQREAAQAEAFLRMMALKSGMAIRPLDGGEQRLIEECYEGPWCGEFGGQDVDALPGMQVKALIADSTSGGLAVVPVAFDQNLVTIPLLNGELLPGVDLVDMGISNRVQAGLLNPPTVTWGTAEGTAITAFTTTGLMSEIDTTIYPVQVAIEVGRDFLSDATLAVGGQLVQVVGQRMAAELDKVIATGDGTTQPQGITVASGTSAVLSDNGAAGPPTVSDAESLCFGIGKQYRVPSWGPCYVMNDTSYRRFRGVAVGPTDERRVFGMNEQSYTMLDYPVRISNDMPNYKAAFLPLRKYRMYRRAGFEVRWTIEGNYLGLRNLALLIVRGRFGGKVVDGASCAVMGDLQT